MEPIERITRDPDVMGGKPCIRGMRVTVGTVVGLLAAGHSEARILEAYPYLEPEDIRAALEYAAFQTEEEAAQARSQVIEEQSGRGHTVRDLAALLDRVTLRQETLDAIDAVIEDRQRDLARSVDR